MLITDAAFGDDLLARVARAVCGAVPGACVQLRDRVRSDDALLPLAMRLREITRAHRAMLIVNRRPALAGACGADGVHVSAADVEETRAALGPHAYISAPAHDAGELERARRGGADFALVSPIFASPGKGPGRGTVALRQARMLSGSHMGIVALGGIDASNAAECFEAGALGVAAVRALLCAGDAGETAARMVSACGVCYEPASR